MFLPGIACPGSGWMNSSPDLDAIFGIVWLQTWLTWQVQLYSREAGGEVPLRGEQERTEVETQASAGMWGVTDLSG